MNSSAHSDRQAAGAVARAQQLRVTAAAVRRLAGRLTYLPTRGERSAVPAELLRALEEIQQVASEIQRGEQGIAPEEGAGAAPAGAQGTPAQAGPAAVGQAAQIVLAAISVLRGLLASHNGGSLDAPYGLGSPVRVHPGAMCTIVAARAEHLAHELETVAIITANAGRAAAHPAGQPQG